MTKSKSQLRAEAVERLNTRNKYGYYVYPSREELIDLLTDDAHEARGSYEERLHDVPVSDCPYCGCERVVIHDFNDIYENPHSYRVEHIDEKEAFEAGCFETYYAFDSAEKAVEHANMRDLLTDEPMDAQRDSDGTCPDAIGQASNAGDGNCGTVEDGTSQVPQSDSREKLEAEIRYEYNGRIEWEADQIIGWLDRQAAITQDETIHDYNIAARESGRILRDEIAELKADNDCLRDRNEKLDYEVRDWKGEAKTQRNNFYQATEARKHWQRKYETVKAERDELKSKADAHEADKASWQSGYHIDRIAKLQAQRDRYRDLLSKAVDEAQGIVKLMEVES